MYSVFDCSRPICVDVGSNFGGYAEKVVGLTDIVVSMPGPGIIML